MSSTLAESLASAAKHIDHQIGKDRRYVDLSDLLHITTNTTTNLSGERDEDYPSLAAQTRNLGSLPSIAPIERVPLPPELLEQFNHMQCTCLMGLFPDIQRAYLTIDSTIFVWNYADGSDLAYFDGLNEVVLSVGLVRPKQGLFQPHICYLLVLSTPLEIVLLGVSLTEGNGSTCAEMHLQPQPLFSVPSDNVHMLAVTGTPHGRIFLAGKDGNLYEVAYQAQNGWFSRKCRLINHSVGMMSYLMPSFLSFSGEDSLVQLCVDEGRSILYSRSSKGTIKVFDLGVDGQSTHFIEGITSEKLMQLASLCSRSLDKNIFVPLVDISPLLCVESSTLHLMAVSQSGVRFYFTTTENGRPGRPKLLSLVHVRLPPGYAPSTGPVRPTGPIRPSNVHAVCHREGTLLLCTPQSEGTDVLWLVDADTFPFSSSLAEVQHGHEIAGRTWAMAVVPDETSGYLVDGGVGGGLRAEPPLVVSQHVKPSPSFVLLTAQGTHRITKLRPVDQLEHLLKVAGLDSQLLPAFFRLYQPDQACAMCFILACTRQPQVRALAEQAILQFGGEPRFVFPTMGQGVSSPVQSTPYPTAPSTMPASTMSALGSPISPAFTTHANPTTAQQPFAMTASPAQVGNITMVEPSRVLGRAVSGPEVIFSSRHQGLIIYFSRLISPIWEAQVVRTVATSSSSVEYTSTIQVEDISWHIQQVQRLNDFLDASAAITSAHQVPDTGSSLVGDSSRNVHNRLLQFMRPDAAAAVAGTPAMQQQLQQKYQAEAMIMEKNSLRDLRSIFRQTAQVLCLWRLLCQHNLPALVASLPADKKAVLQQMSFVQLVTHGGEVCTALIAALTKRYIADRITTETISGQLRDLCPLLYSAEDAIITKAAETLSMASAAGGVVEKQSLLQESLQLYSQVSLHIPLAMVCSQYNNVQFYFGVVELCLAAAVKRDPQSLAIHFYRQHQPSEDAAGSAAYAARCECYNCIVHCLEQLRTKSLSPPDVSVSSPVKVPLTATAATPSPQQQDAATHFEETLSLALSSTDELLHIALYDWLIQHSLTKQLLQITSAFLENYLKQAAESDPSHCLPALDLLWKYYEKDRNFSAAATILGKLADLSGPELSLQKRLEYLSRAIMCAKSCNLLTSGSGEGEALHILEEKMEVAHIQLQIFQTLQQKAISSPLASSKRESAERAVADLNKELMDVSKLYGDYAEPFHLAESKLAIVHCAGHHDPALVETLWREIIEQELRLSEGSTPDARCQLVKSKVVALGQLYSQSQRYFPAEYLVRHLEGESARLHLPLGWVAVTMRQVGVPAPLLLNLYDRLFKAKDPCWQASGRPLHVLQAIHYFLSAEDLFSSLSSGERAAFKLSCLEAVTSYLVELQSMVGDDEQVRQTTFNFKQLQIKLQRL